MPRYYHPIDAISSAGNALPAYVPTPPIPVVSDPANTASSAVGMYDPTSQTAAPSPAPSAADTAALQKQMNDALKNTDYKAEITSSGGGYTVLKIVQTDTGQVLLQMPTQTALAIVAGLQKSNLDGVAETSIPVGTMMSELA